jgi:hypothetical protein
MAALLGVVSALAAAGVAAAPRISASAPRVEIGELLAGDTAEVEFALENTGADPLKIERVTVSCGCLATSHPGTLNAGEKGVLKVKLVSYPLWNGPIEKQVTVISNDPARPSMELQILARMRPLFRFEPSNPVAINYKRGDVLRQVITITSNVDPPVRIADYVIGGTDTEVRLLPREATDAPGISRLEVTVRPPEKGGDFSSHLSLRTTHPKIPEIPLVITGISQDRILALPAVAYLGVLGTEANADPPRKVSLYKRAGTFRVLEVKTDTPALEAVLGTAVGGNFQEIALRYKGGWPVGPAKGTITVTIDDPYSPTVEIPYAAVVK